MERIANFNLASDIVDNAFGATSYAWESTAAYRLGFALGYDEEYSATPPYEVGTLEWGLWICGWEDGLCAV